MNMNLKDYVKIYNNWLENSKCDSIVRELDSAYWEKHQFYMAQSDSHVALSGDKELEISYNDSELNSYVMQRLWDAYFQYVKELNFDWFQGWSGFTKARYNKYKQGQLMALHCDHINSIFEGSRKGIPVLTALGCLNEDYEGGEFIMWDEVIPMKKGDIIVFPSVFLYPHKVNEVTKGERYTFVSWAW